MSSEDGRIVTEAPEELTMPIGTAMYTQRAIRRMRPDPIPEEHLRIILEAAGKAPNGGNNQRARYLYTTDASKRAAFGEVYRRSWWRKRFDMEGWRGPEDIPDEKRKRYESAMRLANEIGSAPCIVFVLSEPPHFPESVLPSAQNLMLAARALGIGSVPTRLHDDDHEAFREIFSVPERIALHLCIPLGYPAGAFGPTRRLPSWVISFADTYGSPVPWSPPVS